VAGNS
ncbi:hypothetical protein KGM_208424B, partial [Danaus plexippus plexippus]